MFMVLLSTVSLVFNWRYNAWIPIYILKKVGQSTVRHILYVFVYVSLYVSVHGQS